MKILFKTTKESYISDFNINGKNSTVWYSHTIMNKRVELHSDSNDRSSARVSSHAEGEYIVDEIYKLVGLNKNENVIIDSRNIKK